MIGIAMLVAIQAATSAPMPEPNEDIVVIAQRLHKVRFSYHAKDGQLLRCDIKTPSGSKVADAIVCEAARQCAAGNPTVGDRHLVPCIKDRIGTLFAAYRSSHSVAS